MCAGFADWAGDKTRAQFVTEADIPGVDPQEYAEHAVFVDGGQIHRGHHAIAALLSTMSRPWQLLAHIIDNPVVSPLSSRVYRFVANHRTRRSR